MSAPTTRRQRLTVLAICSMSLLIVGLDITIVNVALPAIRRVAVRLDSRPAVGDRRVHAGDREPPAAGRIDRGSDRSPSPVRPRAEPVHARLGGVRGGAEPRAADRCADLAGDRRLDAQSGRAVDHPQHLPGPAGARRRDRRVGGDAGDQRFARAGARRSARRHRRLALGVPRQRADRSRMPGAHPTVRAGVAGAAPAPDRSRGPDPDDRGLGSLVYAIIEGQA